jgi:hypothetical protein
MMRAIFLLVATAAAQDFNAEPVTATINLAAGFTPDPRVVSLRAGGEINAQTISADCQGFIANAPDVRLHYQAGGAPLILSVAAAVDTTLVVNAPDGSWYCDDDGGPGARDPALRFSPAQSGRYEIWVGTYGATRLHPAQLRISAAGGQ